MRLTDEDYQRVQRVISANEWTEEGGLRYILYRGLASLEFEEETKAQAGQQDGAKAQEDLLRRHLMEISSDYAALRFQNYELYKDNQALKFQVTGLSSENAQFRIMVNSLKLQIEKLRQELAVAKGIS